MSVQDIARTATTLLMRKGQVAGDGNVPLFDAWARPDRVVLVFDPLRLRDMQYVTGRDFCHDLSTALGGRLVQPVNSRGVFLQVNYHQPASTAITAQPLNFGDQATPFQVPIGVTRNGSMWLSILTMDSVLIGGTRRMGKTRLLHGWIQALLHGGQTHLYLWDGKPNCVEFAGYRGYPNTTVIGETDLLVGLQAVKEALEARSAQFAQAGLADIHAFNAQAENPIDPIVLIIDELSTVGELPDAAEVVPVLEDLIKRGGAFGIYPVLATQRPTANAVRGISKINLSTRIALPVPSHTDSRIILERSGAEKLPKVQGRLALVWQAELIEAQAFLVDLPKPFAGGGTVVITPMAERPASPRLSADEQRMVVAAVEKAGGYFRVRDKNGLDIPTLTGLGRERVTNAAARLAEAGLLTDILYDGTTRLGRRVTPELKRLAGLEESKACAKHAGSG